MRNAMRQMGTTMRFTLFAAAIVIVAPTIALADTKLVGADLPSMTSAGSSVRKGLIYCVAFLLLGLSLYKKYGIRRGSSAEVELIEVLARRSLGPRSAVILVQIAGERMVLAQSGDNLNLLTRLESRDPFAGSMSGAYSDLDEELAHALLAAKEGDKLSRTAQG